MRGGLAGGRVTDGGDGRGRVRGAGYHSGRFRRRIGCRGQRIRHVAQHLEAAVFFGGCPSMSSARGRLVPQRPLGSWQ